MSRRGCRRDRTAGAAGQGAQVRGMEREQGQDTGPGQRRSREQGAPPQARRCRRADAHRTRVACRRGSAASSNGRMTSLAAARSRTAPRVCQCLAQRTALSSPGLQALPASNEPPPGQGAQPVPHLARLPVRKPSRPASLSPPRRVVPTALASAPGSLCVFQPRRSAHPAVAP